MRVVWAPLALDRATEIARHIARERPATAARWLEGLLDLAAGLGRAPRRGRKVPEVGRSEIREVHYGPYRVIYRLEPRRVAILTVRHARRRFDPAELGGEPPRG